MKKTVKVYSKNDFREHLDEFKNDKNTAIISIECSPECIQYYLESKKGDTDNDHILSSSNRVLNIDFDDVVGPGDYYYDDHWMKALTGGQAYSIVEFIENNLDKNFVIHCKAGKSRSKAVGRFILDCHGDEYENGNLDNPIDDCNIDVLTKLKDKFYSKYKLYWYIDNKVCITKEAMEDAGKYVHVAWMNDDYPGDYSEVKDEDVLYLIGAVDGIEDYYWVFVDRDFKLSYHSCVGGYGKIYDIREFPSLTQPLDRWMDRIEDKEAFKEDVMKQLRNFIISSLDGFFGQYKIKQKEWENDENYTGPTKEHPERGILYIGGL